ncbi:DgyrCDS3006 [Dimorphilus gyrociliatus]|uniref:DgyrCDS3006 n=1 Tax=Dimorphilus gyrociliatus TaxID=2664684 RepID=A0A7I8VBX2_9ANNE|nr:DgyrCDS3006 [Dimorphilus gyrociliatus]
MQSFRQQLADSGSKAETNPEATWWCKLLARGVSIVAAFIAFILGIGGMIGVPGICTGAGLLQILAAAIVLMIEAPCCFHYLEITKPLVGFAERRSFLQRGIAYGILSIPPLAMCFSFPWTVCGSGLIFAGGVLYGLMGLGRKADRDEMKMKATGQGIGNEFENSKDALVTHDRSGAEYGQP